MNDLEVRFTIEGQKSETRFTLIDDNDKYQLVGIDANGEEHILNLGRDSDTGLLFFDGESLKFEEEETVVTERLNRLSSELVEKISFGLDIADGSDDGSFDLHDENSKPGYTPDQVYVENKPFSLSQLMDLIKDGDLEIAPDFQRHFVWDRTRQSKLIESILLGLPLPSMYLSQYDDGRLTIVDGLQRINTINYFLKNELRLCNMEYLTECNNCTFEELKENKKLSMLQIRRFRQTQIMCFVIDYRSPAELKYDLFRRLNTGGKVLNDQEIRNCMSRRPLQTLLLNMANLPSFKSATQGDVKDTRMAAQEAALKFIYFYDEYSEKNPIGNYNGVMSRVLDNCVERLNKEDPDTLEKYIPLYDKSMSIALELFGKNAFRKIRADGKKRPINKLLMLAISVLLAKHSDRYTKKVDLAPAMETLLQDERMDKCISLHTSNKANIEYVFSRIKENLFDRYLLNNE